MEDTKKYISEHTNIQEVISILLNKPKLFGINRYGKWGPIKKLIAVLKIVCIGNVREDGLVIVSPILIEKKALHVYVGKHISKEELKNLKYKICIVNKYNYITEEENNTKIQLDDIYIIRTPKIIDPEEISLDINMRLLSITSWRDTGDDTLITTNTNTHITNLFSHLNGKEIIEIDPKKIIAPIRI